MTSFRNPAKWLIDWFRGTTSGSVAVTERSVLGVPAVWYAVNKISNNFSQLPCAPMERMEPRGAKPATAHVAYRPSKSRPNKYMNASVFKQKIITDALIWGDGRAAIVDRGREYLPLNPDRTITMMVEGEKKHVTMPDADERILEFASSQPPEEHRQILFQYFLSNSKKVIVLDDRQVLHLMGFTLDGVSGVSIVEIAKQTFETSLASRKHVNNQWQKGFTGRIMLEAPVGAFRQEGAAKEFLDEFKKAHSIDGDNEVVGMLRENVTAKVLNMNARDAQWAEQMADSRRDIALLFLLESILGDDQSVSFKSLEEKNLAFLVNCLSNWLKRWEEECDEKLLTEQQKRNNSHFFKFNTGALLRTNIKSTMETLSMGVTARIYSPNDAREKLDENPYEGGDEYLNPAIDTKESQGEETTQARAAILSRIRHMIGVEAGRVSEATSFRNYVSWLDNFYEKWQGTFSDVVVDCGGDKQIAVDHCRESKEVLLNACGGVKKDALPEAIENIVANWDGRAEAITEQILKG